MALATAAQAAGNGTAAQPQPTDATATAAVHGLVLNEEGKPLVGATVVWKGSPFGVTTDANGRYQLPLAVGHSVVLYSYAGYADDEVSVRGAGVHNVTLIPREEPPTTTRSNALHRRIQRVFN